MKEQQTWEDFKHAFVKIATERRYLWLRGLLLVAGVISACDLLNMCVARPLSGSLNRPVPMVVPVDNALIDQPDIIEAILSKSTAADGLILGKPIKISECPSGADTVQLRELDFQPGFGFYDSSRGLSDREVYNRLFVNTNFLDSSLNGRASIECLQGQRILSQNTVNYSIKLVD